MLRSTYVEEYGFTYILASHGFSLAELYDLIASVPTDPIPPQSLSPVLLDLREVHLDHVTEVEIRRHTMRKSSLDPRLTSLPVAYVVRDLEDYSVVRMAMVFSELSHVSEEKRSLITEHLSEAVAWLIELTGAGADGTSATLDETQLRSDLQAHP